MRIKPISFVLALSIFGCGGGNNAPTAPTPTTPSNVSFSASIQPIFNNRCVTNCHMPGGDSSFMPLVSGVSRTNLVNQPSTNSGAGIRVIPGDSANSILYKRISGTSAGTQMPQGSTPLSQNDQQLIRVWIDEGAKDN